jgi:malonyl CoA-acyl carrier protein transacylase
MDIKKSQFLLSYIKESVIKLEKLISQVTSPVQWETTVKTLLSKGLTKSYELGPGKVR